MTAMCSKSLVRFLLPLAMAATAASAAEPPPLPQPEAYQQRLVDWIRSGTNGYFHPQVQWQRLGGTGPYAMFTTVDLPKGTKLLTVPRSHVIDSFQTHDECVTVARMLGEHQKGEDSFFAPYLSYLFDETAGGTTTGLLPGAWSEDGQFLLQFLLLGPHEENDDGLEPQYFQQPDVFETCKENFRARMASEELTDPDERQHAQDAFLYYISRSWTDKMVPVLDMYNHRNGKSLNVESTSAHDLESDIIAYALRDIKAGEQLQNSYSECMDHDCEFGAIKYSYNSAQIFNDYGFVEFYPRRWPMNPADQELVAEVDEDLETGEKSFQWIFDTPSQATLQWMEAQLERLQGLDQNFRKAVADHKANPEAGEKHHNIEHEADSLLELLDAYVEVLEMGLKHKAEEVGVTFEQFQEELQEARRSARFGGEL